jgi:predicted ATPase
MPRRYVLTGALGAGKIALALALRDLGYVIVAEAATDVIAIERARGATLAVMTRGGRVAGKAERLHPMATHPQRATERQRLGLPGEWFI